MAMYETSDLHQRVERYETALDELRAAHQDIKNVLHEQVLYERWQQLGAELGFTAGTSAQPPAGQHAGQLAMAQPVAGQQHDLSALNHQIPQMSDSWTS
jgi:hypothetical protein